MNFPLLPSPWMTDEHQMLAGMTRTAPGRRSGGGAGKPGSEPIRRSL